MEKGPGIFPAVLKAAHFLHVVSFFLVTICSTVYWKWVIWCCLNFSSLLKSAPGTSETHLHPPTSKYRLHVSSGVSRYFRYKPIKQITGKIFLSKEISTVRFSKQRLCAFALPKPNAVVSRSFWSGSVGTVLLGCIECWFKTAVCSI